MSRLCPIREPQRHKVFTFELMAAPEQPREKAGRQWLAMNCPSARALRINASIVRIGVAPFGRTTSFPLAAIDCAPNRCAMRVDCPQCSVEFQIPREFVQQPGRWLRCGYCDCSWFEFVHEHQDQPTGDEVAPRSPPSTAIVTVSHPQYDDASPVRRSRSTSDIAMGILDGSFTTTEKARGSGWFGRMLRLRRQS